MFEQMTNRELIFYGGLILGVIYLFTIIILQITKTNKLNQLIKNARKEYNQAVKLRKDIKDQLINQIEKIYGQEKAEKVNVGTIWLGMPMPLLLVALGRADDIKQKVLKKQIVEKWYYYKYITRLGTTKYRLEITVEDNEVIGWKDLD